MVWLRHHRPARVAWSQHNNRLSSMPERHHTSLSFARKHPDTLHILRSMLQTLPTPTRVLRCTCQPQDHHRHNVLLITQVNMHLPRHHDRRRMSSRPSILPVPWDLLASHMAISRTHSVMAHPHRHRPQTLDQSISHLCPTQHHLRHQRPGNQRMQDMVAKSGPTVILSSASLKCTILLEHSPT